MAAAGYLRLPRVATTSDVVPLTAGALWCNGAAAMKQRWSMRRLPGCGYSMRVSRIICMQDYLGIVGTTARSPDSRIHRRRIHRRRIHPRRIHPRWHTPACIVLRFVEPSPCSTDTSDSYYCSIGTGRLPAERACCRRHSRPVLLPLSRASEKSRARAIHAFRSPQCMTEVSKDRAKPRTDGRHDLCVRVD